MKREHKVTKLKIPVRRSKGSKGDITVQWSLHHNRSSVSADLIWPTFGKLSIGDGQWNTSLELNVADNKTRLPGSVIWVQLKEVTGGALLASEDKATAKIVIVSNTKSNKRKWLIIILVPSLGTVVIIILIASRSVSKYKKKLLLN